MACLYPSRPLFGCFLPLQGDRSKITLSVTCLGRYIITLTNPAPIENASFFSGFVHSFLFFFFIRSVEKVLSVQTILSSTKSFILMINLLNVTHAKGHSTKKSASESTFHVKNMKNNRKSSRILLRKRIKLETNPNDRKKLLQKLRNQAILKTFHKRVQVIRRITQQRIAARFQTILVCLHLLTLAKVPY